MERTMSVEDKIRRAEEIYYRRREQEAPEKKLTQITSDNNVKISIKLVKKMIKQIIGCLAIYAVVYAVVNNNYVFSEDFTNKAREILNQDIDFKEIYFVLLNKIQEIESKLNQKEESTKEQQENEQQNQEQGQEQQSDNVEEVKNENTSSESVQNEEDNIEEKNIGGANIQENGDNLVENNEVELSQMEKDAKYIKETVNFIKPINGKISSGFGLRNPTTASVPKNHTGTDIAANTGTKILSATDGNVILASSTGDYGNHLKIQVRDVVVVYAHCNALYVKQGENVKQGQEIAEVGATGNATGPHLHFEIRYQDRYVNPQLIMEL